MSKARDLANAGTALTTVSATELGYLDGVTSAVQTQVDAKIAKTLTTTTGDIIYASSANTPARLGVGSTGNVLTVSGGVPAWAAPAAGGKVLQVVSSYIPNSTSFSTTSGTYVDATGFSLAITPTANTSKILAIFDIGIVQGGSSANNIYSSGQILRDSTVTWTGTISGLAVGGSAISLELATNRPLIYLDSPATTSSTTYKLQVKRDTGTVVCNGGGLVSSITLMEIGA